MESSEEQLRQQTLRDYLAVLFRRKWVVLATFGIVLTAGAVATALTTRVYRAESMLLVEATNTAPAARTGNPLVDLQRLAQPQSVAMHLLQLEGGPFVSRAFRKAQVPRDVEILDLSADSSADYPGIIEITVESTDARAAARLANTVAEEYLLYTREQSLNEMRAGKRFLIEERARVEQALNEAEADLLAFRRRLGVPRLDAEQDSRTRQVLDLEKRLEETTNAMARVVAQMTEVKAQLERESATNRVASERPNLRRDALEGRLAELETQRAALLAEYKEDAPQLVGIDAQIKRMKERLAAEPEALTTEQLVPNLVRDQLRARLQELDFTLLGHRAERKQLSARLAVERERAQQLLPREVQLASLTNKRDEMKKSLATLNEKLKDLDMREKQWSPTARVFEYAGVPSSPIKPRQRANLLMSAMLGMILSVGLAFLMESLDDRITTPEEVERELGLPVMGYLPLIPSRDSLLMTGLPARSPISESYRALRTAISFAAVDGPLRTLVVSSSDKSEGKSLTTINLAIAMAMDGRRVILVDSDLRRPTLHRLLEWEVSPGLTDVLLGERELEEALRDFPDVPGLRLMTCGELPPNPAELLNSVQMGELIGRLAGEADVVLFDCPPVLPVTDATLLSTKVDGVLLVAAVGKARRAGLKYTKAQFDRARARLIGLVFNKVSGNLGSSYPYYDRRYYEEDRRRLAKSQFRGLQNGKRSGGKVRALAGRSGETKGSGEV